MTYSPKRLLAVTALAGVAAVAPASAVALAGTDTTPQLGGSPQLRLVNDNRATLNFAADRIPRTSSGRLDASISFVNGARVRNLRATGTHGNDITYSATVTSSRPFRVHAKYRVRFRLGDSPTVTRQVKLFRAGERG